MPDTKITALTAIATVDPAVDVLPIVDVSDTSMAASGTTKKITSNQILQAGGTATLASATITGDLTVDTSTLKVDSANDRVGVGLAAGINAKLHVSSTGSVHINQRTGGNGCFTQYIDPASSNYIGTDSGNFRIANNSAQDLVNIQQLGVFTFGDGAGGTRMTLNSTGLGVGLTPVYKIHTNGVIATTNTFGAFTALQSAGGIGYRWTLANDNNFYLAYSTDAFGSTSTNRVIAKANGQIRFVPLAADPAGAEAGDVYYNSTSNKLKCYNGTSWNDLF